MVDSSYVPEVGAARQILFSATDLGLPASTTLPASGTAAGTLLLSQGAKHLAVSAQAAVNGTLHVKTYADAAGTVLIADKNVAITGGSSSVVVVNGDTDGEFAAWQVSIANGTAGASTCQANGAVSQA